MSDIHINHALLPLHHDDGACCLCGCTEDRPCPDGCAWADDDLCTACAEVILWICSPGRTGMLEVEDLVAAQTNPNILMVALLNARSGQRQGVIRTRLERLLGRALTEDGR